MIVCVSNIRIILIEIDQFTGNPTENIIQIPVSELQNIKVKKGFFKTKLVLQFPDNNTVKFSPNNICIGLSNHKKNLIKLSELYS